MGGGETWIIEVFMEEISGGISLLVEMVLLTWRPEVTTV